MHTPTWILGIMAGMLLSTAFDRATRLPNVLTVGWLVVLIALCAITAAAYAVADSRIKREGCE